MHIVADIFRGLFLVLGTLAAVIYIGAQAVQKLPKTPWLFKPLDWIACGGVACLFGFGFNSYWALLSFLVPLGAKFLGYTIIKPQTSFLGVGFWFEVQWKAMTPRGFGSQFTEAMSEMNRIPKQVHIILPRFFVLLGLKLARWQFQRTWKKQAKNVQTFSQQQQDLAYGELLKIMQAIAVLEKNKTETKSFPFGVLKVNRY